jgi:hypothetical protein
MPVYYDPLTCHYCSGEAGYYPLDIMEEHNIKIYFCNDCNVEYLKSWSNSFKKWFTQKPFAISMYTKINGKMYRWSITTGVSVGVLWMVGNPGIPGLTPNSKLEVVKTFNESRGDVVPNITPKNIEEKVRTYLVFL